MNIVICDSKEWFYLDSDLIKKHKINFIKKNESLKLNLLKKLEPDYIFFVHWNWIVAEEIHKKYNCILFHTSPLPYGRGGSPIQNLIKNGHSTSPVCALKMVNDLDSGPIYSKIEISLEGKLSEILLRIKKQLMNL